MVTISSPRLGFCWPPRTVTVKGGRRPSRSDSPLTVTSTAAGYVGRVSFPAVSANNVNSEGSSPSGAKIARILVFGRSVRIGTMMQSCASRRSSEAAGPFFIAAWKPWRSVGSPPPRTGLQSCVRQIRNSSLTGSYVMEMAEQQEPYELRGSRGPFALFRTACERLPLRFRSGPKPAWSPLQIARAGGASGLRRRPEKRTLSLASHRLITRKISAGDGAHRLRCSRIGYAGSQGGKHEQSQELSWRLSAASCR